MRYIILSLTIFFIGVFSTNAQTVLSEDFTTSIPGTWTVDTTGGAKWQHNDSLGANYTGCVFVDEGQGSAADSGNIQTPAVDLSQINNPKLNFKMATVNNNFIAPKLTLYYSTGSGWVKLNSWGEWDADSLVYSSNDYVWPLDTASFSWTEASYDLSALASSTNIRFAFEANMINGGYLLLDSVRISDPSTASVINIGLAPQLTVYPNPANDMVFINTNGKLVSNVVLTDMMGRDTKVIDHKQFGDKVSVQLDGLPNGLYTLSLFGADGVLGTARVSIVR